MIDSTILTLTATSTKDIPVVLELSEASDVHLGPQKITRRKSKGHVKILDLITENRMAHRNLFHQKILEKLGSISEQKETLTSTLHSLVDEASTQFARILRVEEDGFLLGSYMEIMTILDQCLNSLVMLTAVADTVQESYAKSICGIMQESSKGASSLSVERKTTQTSSGSRVNDGPKLSTSNGHDSLRMGLKLVTSNGHDGCVARTNSSGFNTGVVESEVEQKVSLVHNRPSDKSKVIEVYIGNLQSEVTDADIEDLVQSFNPHSFRCLSKKDAKHKKFAFVNFWKLPDAEECVKALNNKCHRGRFLRTKLINDYQEEGTTQAACPSTHISLENDSCYNSLTADKRGNYSLCYPKDKEPVVTTQAVRERFSTFADFFECHFTGRFIFVRFKSKKGAVAAYEKFYKELEMKIPSHGEGYKYSKLSEPGLSKNSNVCNVIPDEPHNGDVKWGLLTSSSRTDLNTESYDQGSRISKKKDASSERVFCVPSVKMDSDSTDHESTFTEGINATFTEGVNATFLKQLQKIWDN